MNQNEKLLFLIKYLLSENPQYQNIEIPTNKTERFRLFRNLVNIRPPKVGTGRFSESAGRIFAEGNCTQGHHGYCRFTADFQKYLPMER